MQRHAAFRWFIFIIVFSCAGSDIFQQPRLGREPWLKLIKWCHHRQLRTFLKENFIFVVSKSSCNFLFSPNHRARGIRQRTVDAKPGRLCRDISLYDSNCELMTHWPNSGLQQSAICIPYYLFRVLAVIPTQIIHIHAILQFLREFLGILV